MIETKELKTLSQLGELEYAPVPPSGRGDKGKKIKLKDILNKLKPFSVRKPVAYIVGSLAVHGESNNDIDIVVRGEDWSPEQRMAFDFRIYRMFADILGVPYDEVPKYVSIHYTSAGPFTSYVPIYEETFIPIKNPQIVHMSKSNGIHFDLQGNFRVMSNGKAKKSRRIIAGYASVAIVDKDNEIIPVEVLKDAIKTLLNDEFYANVMVKHQNIQIGRILREYGNLKTHVDDKGLFIVAEIRDDLEIANRVWEDILKGKLNSFSIAGEALLSHRECDENQCYTVIDKINIYEVSVCESPANPLSGFIVISKSEDVCGCEKTNENMTEDILETGVVKDEECNTEEQTETVSEEKTETEDIETWKEEIERKLESLTKIVSELVNSKTKEEEEETKEEVKEEETVEEKQEDEDKEGEETTEKQGGLVGAIVDALTKLIDEVKSDSTKAKLQTILDMVANLRRSNYPYPYPYPTSYPYPSKYPYPTKAEWHEVVVKAIDDLWEKYEAFKSDSEKAKEIEQLKLEIKAKDDQINALQKRLEALEKAEKPPETINKSEDEEEEEEYSDIVIKHGTIYRC
ncbi:MAG: hypothetical protein DRP62_00095 [Planctomycetota bacterium]|nr:MAG: hypothetical protein DRP62_00095 [Planctomycetota bacterium]